MLNKDYWQSRYDNQQTGWDTGSSTLPIKKYVDGITDPQARILIPGCGNGHEARYLHQQGFENVYVCDWAAAPLEALAASCPAFPKEHLIQGDFFAVELEPLDYILEQTFFCAIDPALRPNYAKKTAQLLKQGGKVAGVLFNENLQLGRPGPPFGGNAKEYRHYFEPHFSVVELQPCYNSIPPRAGSELFVQLTK
jgi:SAM-dependent methyltransferase